MSLSRVWITAVVTTMAVSLAAGQSGESLERSLSTEMGRVRRGESLTGRFKVLESMEGMAALDAIARYAEDRSPEVRHFACKLAWRIAPTSDDQAVRRRAAEGLVRAMSDAEPIVWQHAAKYAMDFRSDDFNAQSRQWLHESLVQPDPKREVIRLVGLAGMTGEMPKLRTLLIDESQYETGEQAGKWYGTKSWAARLALARLGDEAAANRCVHLVEVEPNEVIRVTVLLRDLAYTRRPEAVTLLGNYLNDDSRLPPTKVGSLGTPYNQYAVDLLAELMEGFPVERKYIGAYTSDDLRTARRWMRRHLAGERQ